MVLPETIEEPEVESEWQGREKHVEIECWAIVQTLQKHGRWTFREVLTGSGGWDELVYELCMNWNQFVDELEVAKNRYKKIDQIADRLAKTGGPYEFKMPDGTDAWYYAYSKPAIFRINHEGKLE